MSDKYNIGLKVMIQAFTMFGCMYAGLEVTGDRRSRLQNNVKNAIAFTAFLAGLLLAWLESCMPYASFFSTEMLVVLLVIVLAEMQCKVIKTMLLPQNKTIPVLFTAYITALMYITIFCRIGEHFTHVQVTMEDIMRRFVTQSSMANFKHAFLNLILFVPMGWFLPFMTRRKPSFLRYFAIGALVSTCIESTQLMLSMGECDVVDIAMNGLGCAAGHVLFKICYAIVPGIVQGFMFKKSRKAKDRS